MRNPQQVPDVIPADILKLYEEMVSISSVNMFNIAPKFSLETARMAAREQESRVVKLLTQSLN